jgi:predicted ATP-binding protein involved in virulence
MHIKEFELKNIRGIKELKVKFDRPAGWHVFIGDNGTGKSTVLRSLVFSILGEKEANKLNIDYASYISNNSESGSIAVSNSHPQKHEYTITKGRNVRPTDYHIIDTRPTIIDLDENTETRQIKSFPFFCSFGAFRRLKGDNSKADKINANQSPAAAHESLFDDSITLNDSITFLRELNYKSLEGEVKEKILLDALILFINSTKLLPNELKIKNVSSNGVLLASDDSKAIPLEQMSDGVRTVLGLVLEIIRLLVVSFGFQTVAESLFKNKTFVHFSGVILIDEVDIHLHPTWQTRIGDWFVDHFPNIQFIVTTHSPLICRAAKRGSIWQMSPPHSDEPIKHVTGVERDRLLYGNVLDAYGTHLFGENTTSSEAGTNMREELADLHQKMLDGVITDEERNRMFELRAKMPTEKVGT